jgi:hypothetical protein
LLKIGRVRAYCTVVAVMLFLKAEWKTTPFMQCSRNSQCHVAVLKISTSKLSQHK